MANYKIAYFQHYSKNVNRPCTSISMSVELNININKFDLDIRVI